MEQGRSRIRLMLTLTVIGIGVACATSPTGRKQLVLVPEEQMATLGAQAFQEIKSQTAVENDAAINNYVKCVAKPISNLASRPANVKSWEIVVFQDPEANAFALPGGKIGVNTGLLQVAKSDDQLAAVIGHEVGHVLAKHGAERVSEGLVAQGGLAAVGAITGNNPNRDKLLGLLGVGAQFGILMPHSRTQESEADAIGLDLMARAGFDPRESVTLWQNMKAASRGAPPEFLSTHPSPDSRIADLKAGMNGAVAKYQKATKGGRGPKCSGGGASPRSGDTGGDSGTPQRRDGTEKRSSEPDRSNSDTPPRRDSGSTNDSSDLPPRR